MLKIADGFSAEITAQILLKSVSHLRLSSSATISECLIATQQPDSHLRCFAGNLPLA
jgi:hypothetical protein